MRYLLLLFLPLYLWHAYGEISVWRRREAPTWALVAMIFSKVFLAVGVICFVFAFMPEPVRDYAFRITSVCMYFEFYFAFKSSPPKAEHFAGKAFEDLILVVLILLISGTAAFFARLATSTPAAAVRQLLFILLIAYLVARLWTGSRGGTASRVAAAMRPDVRLREWLAASPDFGRAPDEMVLADQRTQFWPGYGEVQTALYRVRLGAVWYVALAEPVCHCIAKPVGPDVPLGDIYDAYKEWFADDVSRRMIMEAAGELGDKRFESLVKKAMSNKSAENSGASDGGSK